MIGMRRVWVYLTINSWSKRECFTKSCKMQRERTWGRQTGRNPSNKLQLEAKQKRMPTRRVLIRMKTISRKELQYNQGLKQGRLRRADREDSRKLRKWVAIGMPMNSNKWSKLLDLLGRERIIPRVPLVWNHACTLHILRWRVKPYHQQTSHLLQCLNFNKEQQ